jgi:hypothetical protein
LKGKRLEKKALPSAQKLVALLSELFSFFGLAPVSASEYRDLAPRSCAFRLVSQKRERHVSRVMLRVRLTVFPREAETVAGFV